MQKEIPINFQQGLPLPIPHCFGFPEYTPNKTFDVIVPEDYSLDAGDSVVFMGQSTMHRKNVVVSKIVTRRPAKGDWSKQAIHSNPHFVRFISE